jgi:hypothetical protein
MNRRTQLILLLCACAAASLAGGLSQVLADCFWECRRVRFMQANEDLEWNGIMYQEFPVCYRFLYDTPHDWPYAGTDVRRYYKIASTPVSPCPPSQRPARVGSGTIAEGDWRPTWCHAYCWTPH